MFEAIKKIFKDEKKRLSVIAGVLMLVNIYNAVLGTTLLGIAGALLWLHSDGKLFTKGKN